MQIHVRGPVNLATDQMRAYAEYRVFAALSRFGRSVRGVMVGLEPANTRETGGITCLIEIDAGMARPIRCRSTERQTADAIDSAAARARRVLERHTRQAVTS